MRPLSFKKYPESEPVLGRSQKGPCSGPRVNETIRYTLLYLTDTTYNGR